MTNTGFTVFDETIQKTNALLKEIELEFGWENQRHLSYAALRAILHELRDRLTVEESADLSSQLPLLIKGIYYDGWTPSKVPKKIDEEEFIKDIRQNFPYSMDRDITELISVVIKALKKYVSEGELEDVLSILPKKLSFVLRCMEGDGHYVSNT